MLSCASLLNHPFFVTGAEKDVALHVEGGETTSAEAAPKIETAVDESKLDTAAVANSEPVGTNTSAADPVAVVGTAAVQVRCCSRFAPEGATSH